MLHPSGHESRAPILDVDLLGVSISLKGYVYTFILELECRSVLFGVSKMVWVRQKRIESGWGRVR